MSTNWWAAKLGGPQQTAAVPAPAASVPDPPNAWWAPTPQSSTPQAPPTHQPNLPSQDHLEEAPSKAQVSKITSTCPECGSGNYYRPKGFGNTMEKCFECGYNPRFAHSTAGVGLPGGSDSGPATPARQVSTANNFNPQTVIGKVNL